MKKNKQGDSAIEITRVIVNGITHLLIAENKGGITKKISKGFEELEKIKKHLQFYTHIV